MELTNVELAHDLRMPLQIIYSCAQMIQTAPGDGEAVRQYADMMIDNVLFMQRMLNGTLERCGRVARTEKINLNDADLVRCVRAVCRRCQMRAEEKDVRLAFCGNVAALEMALDEDKLTRILLNLISNALRFTLPGGEIRVELIARGDFAEVAVIDDGCGIPAERIPYIFLRGESDGGYGHGLPIAQKYARMMGGELNVSSEPGHGSTFTLRLPVRAAKEAAG